MIFRKMFEEYLRNKNHPKNGSYSKHVHKYVPPCLSSKVTHILQVNFHYRLTIGYHEHWLTIVRTLKFLLSPSPNVNAMQFKLTANSLLFRSFQICGFVVWK